MAKVSAVNKNNKKHIITSTIEHKAVSIRVDSIISDCSKNNK